MAQEIKIPVSADVKADAAEKAAAQLSEALEGVADAADAIDRASTKAARGIDRLVDRAAQIERVQRNLGQLGINLSQSDAASFLGRWDTMRQARGPGTANVRRFDNFDAWFTGHEGLYSTPREAARHRRAMIETALQDTEYRRTAPPPPPPPAPGGGDDGEEGGGGGFSRGVKRAKSAAFGFGKSMLALAGINSVMGIAGRALDNATEEATGIDTLKRRMGDLGVDFDQLREKTRQAGHGLGVTYVESERLAQSYAKVVGNLNASDLAHMGGTLRTSEGLARAYGIDLEASNQFYGTMAKYGVARDDQQQRRLALLIGDSVAKSGYSGKVDELLGAISDYTSTAARMTLTTPNVGAYANGLTSLLSKGYAGLGPQEAAGILSQADAAIRGGGARGEASQNFIYNALRNFSPGISPLQAQAMWQGGLFSTIGSTFGKGPLSAWGARPRGDQNMTTFDKILATLRPHYRNPQYLTAAMSGITGLDLAQSQALIEMSTSGQLGRSAAALHAAGVDPNSISATGMVGIANIANARGRADLRRIYGQMHMTGLSSDQLANSPVEDLRKAMIRVAATMDQQETKGTATRNSIAGLNDTLTGVGEKLLTPINSIRDGVVALANHFAPDYVAVSSEARAVGKSPYASGGAASAVGGELMRRAMSMGLTKLQAAGLIGGAWAESKFDPKAVGDNGKAFGMFQWHAARWKPFEAWATKNGYDPWTHGAQLAWAVQHELPGTEGRAGALFRNAKTVAQSANAGVQFERPGGYNQMLQNFGSANGYADRLAATQALYGMVDVNVKQPDGTTQTKRVVMSPVSAPHAAGSVPGLVDPSGAPIIPAGS